MQLKTFYAIKNILSRPQCIKMADFGTDMFVIFINKYIYMYMSQRTLTLWQCDEAYDVWFKWWFKEMTAPLSPL